MELKRTRSRIAAAMHEALGILLFTLVGFAVMGYHPGLEDDGVYLAAVKADLRPALYPHDADFFRVQLQATLFDRGMAGFVRATGISVSWAELLWQLVSLYLTLWAVHRIARRLFPEPRARWGGIAMVAAMFALPVAGTALNIADQYLHPRNLATAIILFAVERALARKTWHAVPLLLLSFAVHPIMAAFGASFCFFLSIAQTDCVFRWFRRVSLASVEPASLAAVPLGWIFEPPTPSWRRALETRRYYFLYRWTWYEWLGVLGPPILFWLLWRFTLRRGQNPLARFALGVLLYSVFQQLFAMIILGPPATIRLTPLQPMRYLHLVFIFLVMIAGCLLARLILLRKPARWAVFVLALNSGMFLSQRAQFAATEHIELPHRSSRNTWLEAFAWIRENTPVDAYFALDPYYLASPGEDFHSFRALAERSQLADAIKDTAVVTQVPELGPRWSKQIDAESGWSHFRLTDFKRLNAEFGTDWVLVSIPQPGGLNCPWHDASLAVCQIPVDRKAQTF